MTLNYEDRWAALTSQFRPTVDLARARDEDVRRGQLREAVWGDRAVTVLVVDVDDTRAEANVRPASMEPGVRDTNSVTLDTDSTSLHTVVTVWPDVHAVLSFMVLDALIVQLDESVAARAAAQPHPHSAGQPFDTTPLPGSGVAIAIDEIFDDMEALATVRPPLREPGRESGRAQLPLGLEELMGVLSLSQPEAMSILLGTQTLTLDQGEHVAEAAGVPVAEVLGAAAPLPAELERELLEPRWRDVIRRISQGNDETLAREKLGRDAFALAARTTGNGRSMWRQRIQAVVSAEGL